MYHHPVRNVLLLMQPSVHNVKLVSTYLLEAVSHVRVIVNTVHQVLTATAVLTDIIWIRSWVLQQECVIHVRQMLFVQLASFQKANVHHV